MPISTGGEGVKACGFMWVVIGVLIGITGWGFDTYEAKGLFSLICILAGFLLLFIGRRLDEIEERIKKN
jgi:uncharacterized membrane protein